VTAAPAIRVTGLGKRYRIGAHPDAYGTLRDSVVATARRGRDRLLRRPSAADPTIWAISDITFELEVGEILGVIGANGSGKTTLLKILARVTRPTSGRAWLSGRVGSLLEVGAGFHPELTGRENVYLSGAVLGMPRREIDRKFDEIVEFAGVDRFIDTPVKRYSSGMYMRLAFAVAAHLETEILLIDEVLAVGDVAFQEKCLGTMRGAATAGRTVVFVSHNMVAVQGLCRRVIWLDGGRMAADGPPQLAIGRYLEMHSPRVLERVWPDRALAPGEGGARLRRVGVRPSGSAGSQITMRTPIDLEFEYWNVLPDGVMDLNINLITDRGIVAFESSPSAHPDWVRRSLPQGLVRSRCHIPGDLLIAGRYLVSLSILRDSAIVFHDDAVLSFEVGDAPELRAGYYGEIAGVVRPLLDWTTEVVEPP
jgi:lipopolysaccharide transport system ATP-binding protein